MTAFDAPREAITLRPVDQRQVEHLREELSVSEVVARLLVGRGLCTYDACKRFFRPEIDHFHDPFLFDGMSAAVLRLRQAIDKKEHITVYGDYDVDGVTATSLVVRLLRRLGGQCDYYLPNRLTEGYGLSREGVEQVCGRGTALLVTVDCGISACTEVDQAVRAGVDVIVTDHHEPHTEVPRALAVLNPKLASCEYPDKNLAGVGVALKLCQALVQAAGADAALWTAELDIAALGTAADIVPLVGENRTIVHLGFERLGATDKIGLRALMDTQGMKPGQHLTTRDVVFQIAPCINAAGRLGDPTRGVQLLLTSDAGEAGLFARELVEANRERQALDKEVRREAIAWVQQNGDPQRDFGIVAAQPHWHAGVIGIVASRVVETFFRPTFLFSIGEDGIAKGSGRSIPALHLLDALKDCADLLESFGGHSAAAGATIRSENIDAFRGRFNEAVRSRVSAADLVPRVVADAEIPLGTLSPKLLSIIKQMEPFGPGNMRPVLLCRGLKNRYEPRVVGGTHLKLSVESEGLVMDAIAFNFGGRIEEVRNAETFSLAFALDENEWNGRTSLQMKVKGVEV